MGTLLFPCLALGSEPSTAPHEWPGKVLTYLAGASGAQPGCYGLPETLSIHLNAWMRSSVPVNCSMLACVWNYVCSQIVSERLFFIGRWRRCCHWQEVFSLFSTWPAKWGGQFPSSALVRMEFWRQWWTYVGTHYATGALALYAAQGARMIVEANICIIICLILVPSGISSNFVHSSLQRHKHTHRRCDFWGFASKHLRLKLELPLAWL